MKTKSSIILFLILFLSMNFSCKKAPEPVSNNTKDITGQWNWINSWMDGPISDSNPKTPQNTGIQEIIKFNSNKTWLKIQNSIHIDSGTFSTGHGSYIPYPGSYVYIYDSVVYYRNGISEKGTQDYYEISNDTLMFCGCFAGLYAKSDPTEGASKRYIKQK
jgi:hypothetical protein